MDRLADGIAQALHVWIPLHKASCARCRKARHGGRCGLVARALDMASQMDAERQGR